MRVEKILVATDFSAEAAIALAQGAAIAQKHSAGLILFHVASKGSAAPRGFAAVARAKANRGAQHAGSERANLGERELERLAAPWRQRGLQVAIEMASGSADERIVARAAELGVDLIVTGTRGRTGLARLFIGSIAEKVVRESTTNVLVARPWAESDGGFRRILVAVDFSPASERALRLALNLAVPGAVIDLIHAWEYPTGIPSRGLPSDEGPLASLRDQILASARAQAERWISRSATEHAELRFEMVYGPAAAVIRERLEASPFDLAVTGTRGYRGFQRFVLGSVAEATVRYAPCSVLVANAKSTASQAIL